MHTLAIASHVSCTHKYHDTLGKEQKIRALLVKMTAVQFPRGDHNVRDWDRSRANKDFPFRNQPRESRKIFPVPVRNETFTTSLPSRSTPVKPSSRAVNGYSTAFFRIHIRVNINQWPMRNKINGKKKSRLLYDLVFVSDGGETRCESESLDNDIQMGRSEALDRGGTVTDHC